VEAAEPASLLARSFWERAVHSCLVTHSYIMRRICGQRKEMAPEKDGQAQAPQTSQENAVATTTAKVRILSRGVWFSTVGDPAARMRYESVPQELDGGRF
jgi:hypothetical protein